MALSSAERNALDEIEIGLLAHHPRLAVTLDMESMRRKMSYRSGPRQGARWGCEFPPRSPREFGGVLTRLSEVAPRLAAPILMVTRARRKRGRRS